MELNGEVSHADSMTNVIQDTGSPREKSHESLLVKEEDKSSDLTQLLNELCGCYIGKDQRAYFTQPTLSRRQKIKKLRVRAQNIFFQQLRGPHFVRCVLPRNVVTFLLLSQARQLL